FEDILRHGVTQCPRFETQIRAFLDIPAVDHIGIAEAGDMRYPRVFGVQVGRAPGIREEIRGYIPFEYLREIQPVLDIVEDIVAIGPIKEGSQIPILVLGIEVQAIGELRVGIADPGTVAVRDLSIMIDIGIFEEAGRSAGLGGRFVDIILILEITRNLVPIEFTDGMAGLKPVEGTDTIRTIVGVRIILDTGREAQDLAGIMRKGTGDVEFEVAVDLTMIGDRSVDTYVL